MPTINGFQSFRNYNNESKVKFKSKCTERLEFFIDSMENAIPSLTKTGESHIHPTLKKDCWIVSGGGALDNEAPTIRATITNASGNNVAPNKSLDAYRQITYAQAKAANTSSNNQQSLNQLISYALNFTLESHDASQTQKNHAMIILENMAKVRYLLTNKANTAKGREDIEKCFENIAKSCGELQNTFPQLTLTNIQCFIHRPSFFGPQMPNQLKGILTYNNSLITVDSVEVQTWLTQQGISVGLKNPIITCAQEIILEQTNPEKELRETIEEETNGYQSKQEVLEEKENIAPDVMEPNINNHIDEPQNGNAYQHASNAIEAIISGKFSPTQVSYAMFFRDNLSTEYEAPISNYQGCNHEAVKPLITKLTEICEGGDYTDKKHENQINTKFSLDDFDDDVQDVVNCEKDNYEKKVNIRRYKFIDREFKNRIIQRGLELNCQFTEPEIYQLIIHDLMTNLDEKCYCYNEYSGKDIIKHIHKQSIKSNKDQLCIGIINALHDYLKSNPNQEVSQILLVNQRREDLKQLKGRLKDKIETKDYASDNEKEIHDDAKLRSMKQDIKNLEQLRNQKTLGFDFNDLPKLSPDQFTIVAHGTNMWTIVMAAKFSNSHLLAGDEQLTINPFTTATGESKGTTPLNQGMVSTILVRNNNANGCFNYAKHAANTFRYKAQNFEHIMHNNNINIERSFYPTTYGILSKIPAVVFGNPCGERGEVYSDIKGEAVYPRVLINSIVVPDEFKDEVKTLIPEIEVFSLSEYNQEHQTHYEFDESVD